MIQISFDMTDLDKAIEIATMVDLILIFFEMGPFFYINMGHMLLFFQQSIPKQELLVDTKLLIREKNGTIIQQ
jgi:3-keto-L-gulonate-6-phosphate decarboxylase